MFRVNGPTAGPGGSFVGGDPSVPTPATIVPPWWLTMIQEELAAICAKAGIALDQTNSGQVIAAIMQLIQTAGVAFASDADAVAGTSITQALTPHSGTALVNARINAVVNGAPTALDTLKELADAIGDDANFAATVTAALGARALSSRLIHAGGLVSGGGDLTKDITLQVLAAVAADVIAGSAADRAITPAALAGAGGANANGYWCTLPGGFMQQHGRVFINGNGSSTISSTIVFPQPFTDLPSISIVGNADDGANPGWRPVSVTFPGMPTLVGCSVLLDSTDGGNRFNTGRTVLWQAVGR